MIKTLLWDVDGTLASFEKSEAVSISYLFNKYQIPFNEETFALYKKINKQCWENIEKGLIDRQEALVKRYIDFFNCLNITNVDAKVFNDEYQQLLGENYYPIDHACEVLETLKDYNQYVVSNGSKVAQMGKLTGLKIKDYFKQIFISEEVGYEKPAIEFFNHVKKEINYQEEETVIIGDTLSSDILGGVNSGIHTIWYNPKHLDNHLHLPIDYEVDSLLSIKQCIENINKRR